MDEKQIYLKNKNGKNLIVIIMNKNDFINENFVILSHLARWKSLCMNKYLHIHTCYYSLINKKLTNLINWKQNKTKPNGKKIEQFQQ